MINSNTFSFNKDDWAIADVEPKGTNKYAKWFELKSDPAVRAFFKPETVPELQRNQHEYESAQIAKQLGISCARTEIVEYNNRTGIFSFNVKDEQYQYLDATHFVNPKFKGDSRIHGISLQTIKQKYPHLEKDVVDMLFLDCLIKNADRHGENWEFKCDEDGTPLELCPLFDFDKALDPLAPFEVECSVLYSDDEPILTQHDMFERLCIDYPVQIRSRLDTANAIPGLNSVAKLQLDRMNEIYEDILAKGKTVSEPFDMPNADEKIKQADIAKAALIARRTPLNCAYAWVTEKFAPKQNQHDELEF